MIQVTQAESFEEVLLNPDHIVAVEKSPDGCFIKMADRGYYVIHSLSEIDDKIDNHFNYKYRSSCHHCED